MTETVRIAVIGGSGLYNMPDISDKMSYSIDTPFGKPSADITVGTLRGKRVAFIPRHGVGHIYTPTHVPYRANIFALKSLGVRHIIAVSACGSLREDYAPGHIVVPDQLYDNTKSDRGRSFFDGNLVAHVSVAEPFCTELSDQMYTALAALDDATVHQGGMFITIEGPRFSTKGESNIFRSWGCDLIGMTTSPEAYLAREAEMAYAVMAHVTDYDVWHENEEVVTVDAVIRTMQHNLDVAQRAIASVVEALDEDIIWDCHHALDDAIMTSVDAIPTEKLEAMRPIVGRGLGLDD